MLNYPVGNELSSYMIAHVSAHVLLILFNELWKRDKMLGKPRILSLFLNELNKFQL